MPAPPSPSSAWRSAIPRRKPPRPGASVEAEPEALVDLLRARLSFRRFDSGAIRPRGAGVAEGPQLQSQRKRLDGAGDHLRGGVMDHVAGVLDRQQLDVAKPFEQPLGMVREADQPILPPPD